MIIQNVDQHDPAQIQRIIIHQFWNKLLDSVEKAPGFFLMFWIDRRNRFVNLEQNEVLREIPDIPIPDNFTQADFEKIVEELAIAFQDEARWNQTMVNSLFLESKNGDPETTLRTFRKNLNIRYGNLDKWPSYL